MTRHATIIATAFLVALATLNTPARAETVEMIRVVPVGSQLDWPVFLGATELDRKWRIVILGPTGTTWESPAGCGSVIPKIRPLYHAMVIIPAYGSVGGYHGATRLQVALESPLPRGTMLSNASQDSLECCIDGDGVVVGCSSPTAVFAIWRMTMEVAIPHNSSPMLFTSNVMTTADSIGVVTGKQDEDGFAKIVLTSKGQKPTFATVLTDEWLEPADKIVDILELDFDSETGIALYGGFLEY